MQVVTVSPKFQIAIPAAVRQTLHLKAGQKLVLIETDGGFELRPLRPMREYRGILHGAENDFEREPDRM